MAKVKELSEAKIRPIIEEMGYELVDVEYKKPKVAAPLLVNLFASSTGRYEGNAVGAIELNDRLSTALFLNYYNEEQGHDKNEDTFLDMPKMQAFSAMNRWHYQTSKFVSQSGIKILADRRTSGQTSKTMHGFRSWRDRPSDLASKTMRDTADADDLMLMPAANWSNRRWRCSTTSTTWFRCTRATLTLFIAPI